MTREYPRPQPCQGGAWVVTRYRYPDGTVAEVHAHPQHGPEDAARARALGYPDPVVDAVEAMTYDHDRLHSLLAWVLLKAPSPALHGVARRLLPSDVRYGELVEAEECMVLAVQRFLNLAQVLRNPEVEE